MFANTPQDADESDIYGGVLVSPRAGYVTFDVKACSQVRVALNMDPLVSMCTIMVLITSRQWSGKSNVFSRVCRCTGFPLVVTTTWTCSNMFILGHTPPPPPFLGPLHQTENPSQSWPCPLDVFNFDLLVQSPPAPPDMFKLVH